MAKENFEVFWVNSLSLACRKLLFAIGALAILSTNTFAQGGCLTESVAAPAIGYAMEKQVGRVFCASSGGSIMKTADGDIVCAPGQCLKGDDGRILCSSVPGGEAYINEDGIIKCVDGCLRPAHHMCRRPQ